MNKIVHLKGLIEPKGSKIPKCQRSPCFYWYKEGFRRNLDSRIYFQNLLRDSLAKAKEKFEKIQTSCPQDCVREMKSAQSTELHVIKIPFSAYLIWNSNS